MKLSEKGNAKFWNIINRETGIELYQSETEDLDNGLNKAEFDQDDFNGVVILTVEEANILLKMARLIKEIAQDRNHGRAKCAAELESKLIDRITKAEKSVEPLKE